MIARPSPRWPLLSLLLALCATGCIFGDDDQDDDADDAMAMDGASAGSEGQDGGECYVTPHCDPLSPSCEATEICASNLGAFDCTPVPEDVELVGEGDACGSASCQEGLACVSSCAGSTSGGVGCCAPLCDLEEPQCPMDRECTPYYSEGSTQCYAHVGVCAPVPT